MASMKLDFSVFGVEDDIGVLQEKAKALYVRFGDEPGIGSFFDFLDIVLGGVVIVEQVFAVYRDIVDEKGVTKKEALIQLLDEVVKLPWYLEWADDKVIARFADYAVDKINGLVGHSWFEHIDMGDITRTTGVFSQFVGKIRKNTVGIDNA